MPIIGVDFDNTIVCYDRIFHELARGRGLIASEVPVVKNAVRDALRRAGKENIWTELQGLVYGARMQEAEPFAGVLEFFKACKTLGIKAHIISHRTLAPFSGPAHDLHATARQWLNSKGFYDGHNGGLSPDQVHLEVSKEDKLARIAKVGCTHFIDDLPKFLTLPTFPADIECILFDPHGNYKNTGRLRRFASWAHIQAFMLNESKLMAADMEKIGSSAAALLAAASISGDFKAHPLTGAANNRVFRLDCRGSSYLLKIYFQHPEDSRNRLKTEFEFSTFAWRNQVRALPRPLARDAERGMGLYEFIDGRALQPEEISENSIRQALEFFKDLNQAKTAPGAKALPPASEAVFSLAEHLRCVDRRLEILNSAMLHEQGAAANFIRHDLSEVWKNIRACALRESRKMNWPMDEELALSDRCLSPSDFGFHNAIAGKNGDLRFFDFEYAGWDDPAKMVCDFFCQQAVPAPMRFYELFAKAVAADFSQPRSHLQRMEILFPVYQIKWCCILLNDFLPVGEARRRFAGTRQDFALQREQQLEKAGRLLRRACRQAA